MAIWMIGWRNSRWGEIKHSSMWEESCFINKKAYQSRIIRMVVEQILIINYGFKAYWTKITNNIYVESITGIVIVNHETFTCKSDLLVQYNKAVFMCVQYNKTQHETPQTRPVTLWL
jgi:hypothetical protein